MTIANSLRYEHEGEAFILGGMNNLMTHNLGFPRIGEHRELKKATEAFWKGEIHAEQLKGIGADLRRKHWQQQKAAGIDLIPSNDFSFYDQMLDMSCLLGNVPQRFGWAGGQIDLALRFKIARGVGNLPEKDCSCGESSTTASEMTKWFDTNYHYMVPEFRADAAFAVSSSKPFDEFAEGKTIGIVTKPVLIGPLTYLFLGKSQEENFDRLTLLDRLAPVYVEILERLVSQGADWIQLDEPILAVDLDEKWRAAFPTAYQKIRSGVPNAKILLTTYFGELRENKAVALKLRVDALHLDLTRAEQELTAILSEIPPSLVLSLGVVDGRNIWKNDFEKSLGFIKKATEALGSKRVWVAPSCSLLHAPVSLRQETNFDSELKEWLAFSEEKLAEVAALARLAKGTGDTALLEANRRATASRRSSQRIHRPDIKARSSSVTAQDSRRRSPFIERQKTQRDSLGLPAFPTTTIGSFPQTNDIRSARARWKKGELSEKDYETFLRERTAQCVRYQEEVGIDVLVHGEFERNDMVEYFGEQLDGFAFTAHGWVQSYGSRCVKPPIIFGDVRRPRPMTVGWSKYAQSLTQRPMKGMLTGPITLLQWSFVRNDQPRKETARQIGLAVRDEVMDLEAAGIRIIQIDEPALREGLPLRRNDWAEYLAWATEAFRLAASGIRDETRIHTHMCYCEFNDIIDAIASLDADAISIETSRSSMELLRVFTRFRYPNEVGPGVWDIHSPRVPSTQEMVESLQKAAAVLPARNLWVNPDCGLKTRGWAETKAALKNMVEAAQQMRKTVAA